MIKIKELERIVETIDSDGTQVSKLPSNQQMFDKINEIIRVVNFMEEYRVHNKPNPFMPNER